MEKRIRIMEMNNDEIIHSIQSGTLSICVIGIGRIGLPTALSFANANLPSIGVDINTELVEMINSKIFPLKDEPGYDVIFEKVINNKFSASTKINEIVPESDVIILSLPTPMDQNNVPDYSALISVGKQLGNLLTKNSLVIVESTVEPGFIENELIQEHLQQTTIFSKEIEKDITKTLLTALNSKKQEGETITDFNQRIISVLQKTLQL